MPLIVVNEAILAVFRMVIVVSADVAVVFRPNALSSAIIFGGRLKHSVRASWSATREHCAAAFDDTKFGQQTDCVNGGWVEHGGDQSVAAVLIDREPAAPEVASLDAAYRVIRPDNMSAH